jgi:hypothetical protein
MHNGLHGYRQTSDYFNTVLYRTQSITGVGFQPTGFGLTQEGGFAYSHQDAVLRGCNKTFSILMVHLQLDILYHGG